MKKTYHIKFEEIQPIGNFKETLEKLRSKVNLAINEANEQQKYISKLASLIKLICGEFALIEVLEEGAKNNEVWNEKECILCLLYTHLLIIDLNSCAQKFLNGIEMENPKTLLQKFIKDKAHDESFKTKENTVYKNISVI